MVAGCGNAHLFASQDVWRGSLTSKSGIVAKTKCGREARGSQHPHEHEPYTTARKVTPVTAVRPTWNSAYQRQEQNHDQDRSKHCFFLLGNPASESQTPRPSGGLNVSETAPAAGFASTALVQVEADRNAVARISAVVQIISVVVVVHVDVIAVVPIVGPVFRPRINQAKPITAVLKALTAANEHHGETVHAEPMILAIVATETVVRDSVAVVTATLLPAAVLGLPATCAITLPGNMLPTCLRWTPLLC
jgi:hypothetical protein